MNTRELLLAKYSRIKMDIDSYLEHPCGHNFAHKRFNFLLAPISEVRVRNVRIFQPQHSC